jgi:hypothetical protein
MNVLPALQNGSLLPQSQAPLLSSPLSLNSEMGDGRVEDKRWMSLPLCMGTTNESLG